MLGHDPATGVVPLLDVNNTLPGNDRSRAELAAFDLQESGPRACRQAAPGGPTASATY
ncbi:hypothetical protein GCM10022229_10070 [Luteimonas lutimaris]|uniref:Uncharacterized protein n=1 Tax=Luteimonas lutimaris TaxID=698645 RepID=A0ABP7MD33_9GAMM